MQDQKTRILSEVTILKTEDKLKHVLRIASLKDDVLAGRSAIQEQPALPLAPLNNTRVHPSMEW